MNWYAPLGYLDYWANWLEDHMVGVPVLRYLTYPVVGDPASWIFSHPIFVILGAAIGALLGYLGQLLFNIVGWRKGAIIGAWTVVAIYIPREIFDGHRNYVQVGWAGAISRLPAVSHVGIYVGWLIDGLGDFLGPALLAWFITWGLTRTRRRV